MGGRDCPECFVCRLQNKIKRHGLVIWRGEESELVGPAVSSDVCRLFAEHGRLCSVFKGKRGDGAPVPEQPLLTVLAVGDFYLDLEYTPSVSKSSPLILFSKAGGNRKPFWVFQNPFNWPDCHFC